jgi:hypothetical protein
MAELTDAQRWARANPTRTYERGPVGLTMWSRPATWAFSLRVWRWVLDYHPMTDDKPWRVRRGHLRIGQHLFLLRRWV